MQDERQRGGCVVCLGLEPKAERFLLSGAIDGSISLFDLEHRPDRQDSGLQRGTPQDDSRPSANLGVATTEPRVVRPVCFMGRGVRRRAPTESPAGPLVDDGGASLQGHTYAVTSVQWCVHAVDG